MRNSPPESIRAGDLKGSTPVASPSVVEARTVTRRHASSFALACRLLPREIRADVYRLYFVFRSLDDLVDEGEAEASGRLAAVERWCLHGEAASRETEVLADLSRRHALPRKVIADFCAGMRDDLRGLGPDTEEEVDGYCYRVAGTVGITMAALLGVDGPAANSAAAALGMAMQRTNILRDIDEDRERGRQYVARDTVARFGAPLPGRRESLLRDQIARADGLYRRGLAGIPDLRTGRRAIAAAAAIYREILRQIEREGYGRVPGRAVVPRWRRLLLLGAALALPPGRPVRVNRDSDRWVACPDFESREAA